MIPDDNIEEFAGSVDSLPTGILIVAGKVICTGEFWINTETSTGVLYADISQHLLNDIGTRPAYIHDTTSLLHISIDNIRICKARTPPHIHFCVLAR